MPTSTHRYRTCMLQVRPPSLEEAALLSPHSILMSMVHPATNPALLQQLR